MILWRTYDNEGKNTGLLRKLYKYGDVHVMEYSLNGIQMEPTNKDSLTRIRTVQHKK